MGMGLGQFVPVLLYAGIVAACFLSMFWKPQIGIYVIVPLLPMQVVREKLQELPLGAHLIYFLLFSVIIGLFLKSRLSIPHTPVNRVLLVLAVFLYISLWQGSFYLSGPYPISLADPRVSLWKDYMLMPVLFVATLAAIRTPDQMKLVFLLVCASILYVDRTALMNILSHDFSHFNESKRDGGPLGYAGSNGLATFEAQCSCLLLGFATFEKRRLRKLAIYALLTLTLYCLLFSFSRGGYASFLTGLLVLGLLKNRKMIIVFAAILLSWQTLVPLAVQERVMMTYDKEAGLEQSADERVQLWTDAMDLISTNPVLGTGYATYMYMGRVGQLRDTHNIYVKILVETGIVGMVLFLWLLAKMSTVAIRLFRSAKDSFSSGLALGLLSLLACLFVANLFGDRWTYIEINGIVWVLFAIAARLHILNTSPEPGPVQAAPVLPEPLPASIQQAVPPARQLWGL